MDSRRNRIRKNAFSPGRYQTTASGEQGFGLKCRECMGNFQIYTHWSSAWTSNRDSWNVKRWWNRSCSNYFYTYTADISWQKGLIYKLVWIWVKWNPRRVLITTGLVKTLNLKVGNTLRVQVSSCELAFFSSKSSCRDQAFVPAISPTNSNQLEFLAQLPATCSPERFVWRPVPSCKLGLVAGSNRVCQPLKEKPIDVISYIAYLSHLGN